MWNHTCQDTVLSSKFILCLINPMPQDPIKDLGPLPLETSHQLIKPLQNTIISSRIKDAKPRVQSKRIETADKEPGTPTIRTKWEDTVQTCKWDMVLKDTGATVKDMVNLVQTVHREAMVALKHNRHTVDMLVTDMAICTDNSKQYLAVLQANSNTVEATLHLLPLAVALEVTRTPGRDTILTKDKLIVYKKRWMKMM